MDKKLAVFGDEVGDMSTNIMHIPTLYEGENSFMSYVGNGYIGVAIRDDAAINIKAHVITII